MLRDKGSKERDRRKVSRAVIGYARQQPDVARRARIYGELASMRTTLDHDLRLWAAWKQGVLAEQVRDYDQWIASYRLQREYNPSLELACTSQLVSLYLQTGVIDKAWREVEHLAELPEVHRVELALRRAEVLLASGQADGAERALRAGGLAPIGDGEVSAKAPASALADELWLDIELWSEQFEEAVAHVDRMVKAGIATPRAKFGRARALERLDDERAVEALRNLRDDVSVPLRLRSLAASVMAECSLRNGDVAAAKASLAVLPADTGGLELELVAARIALADCVDSDGSASLEALRARAMRLDATWAQLLAQWHQLPLQVGGQAFLQNASRRDLLATCIACDQVLAPERAAELAWQRLLAADSASTLARAGERPAATLEQVRASLVPSDGVLLAYVPAPLGSQLLRLTEKEVEVIPMRSDRGLRAAVRKLHRELDRVNHSRKRGLEELQHCAAAVAGYVMPMQLMSRLYGFTRIAIHGRELLGGLPFELLPWYGPGLAQLMQSVSPGHEQPWFGLAKALHYQPCLALAVAQSGEHRAQPERDLVLAAATCSEPSANKHGVPAQTLAAADLAQLQPRGLADEYVRTLPSHAVTAEQLFAPHESVGVLTLFAHGIYSAEHACPAGLLLSPSAATDELFADALPAGVRAPAQMVILCTCGAARGALRRGDDSSRHLGGALLQLGTRVVGIADGDLELDGTRRLVAALLDELAHGVSPDLALLAARRTVASNGHIADWSQLRLEGLAAQPMLAAHAEDIPPTPWRTLLVVGLLCAALLFAAATRRRPLQTR